MDIVQLLLIDSNKKYTDSFTPERIAIERRRIGVQRKRARIARMSATLTLDEWFTILNYYNGLCAYCTALPFHSMEHLRPIRKGGGTVADNVVPSCNRCNVLKKNKIAYKSHGELIIIPETAS